MSNPFNWLGNVWNVINDAAHPNHATYRFNDVRKPNLIRWALSLITGNTKRSVGAVVRELKAAGFEIWGVDSDSYSPFLCLPAEQEDDFLNWCKRNGIEANLYIPEDELDDLLEREQLREAHQRGMEWAA